MRKFLGSLITAMLVLGLTPVVLAVDTGTGIGIDMETEAFEPRVWLCDHRVVIDDEVEPGRVDGRPVCSQKDQFEPWDPDVCDAECCLEWACVEWKGSGICTYCNIYPVGTPYYCESGCKCKTYSDTDCVDSMGCFLKGDELVERHNNYAFEGEMIEWKVLVMDKNKIEQIQEVVATIGSVQGVDNDIEVECLELQGYGDEVDILDSCNARIDEEEIDEFDNQIMAYYECTFTVETPDSMFGEYWMTVEAIDSSGESAIMDENEYWFLNPYIMLSVDGYIDFGIVRPGTVSYSSTILVGNDAEEGSGVTLDMFISGDDFRDLASVGSRCVLTNRLKLGDNYVASGLDSYGNLCEIGFDDTSDHFCYYATSGAYSTQADPRNDAEGYVPIVYGEAFTRDFYNDAEIIQADPMGAYWGANMLTPGAEMAVTFKLGLPVPCVGDFTDGQIFFWGEAI